MRRTAAACLSVAALLAGCSDDPAPSEEAATATTLASSTPVSDRDEVDLDFEGDPDSAFCERSRDAAERPVLDPFEPGLDPREVELRFRALSSRFHGFEEVAPDPLAEDLDLLVATFGDFAALLEAAGYDFDRLAEADVDVSVFDDPALDRVAVRLAAYQDQVCGRG